MCSESLNFNQTTGFHNDSLMISILFWGNHMIVCHIKVPLIKPEFIAELMRYESLNVKHTTHMKLYNQTNGLWQYHHINTFLCLTVQTEKRKVNTLCVETFATHILWYLQSFETDS